MVGLEGGIYREKLVNSYQCMFSRPICTSQWDLEHAKELREVFSDLRSIICVVGKNCDDCLHPKDPASISGVIHYTRIRYGKSSEQKAGSLRIP